LTASGNCPHCGAWRATGPTCPACGRAYDAPIAPPVQAATPIPTGGGVLVRTYRAKSQADAASVFQADAARLAAQGYYPVSQSWAEGSWGCGAFLLALVLAVVLIGILIFIYLLVVKPDGTLTVTYQRR
jgi:hypothetical protein